MRKDQRILSLFKELAQAAGYTRKIVGDIGYYNSRNEIFRYKGYKNGYLVYFQQGIGIMRRKVKDVGGW